MNIQVKKLDKANELTKKVNDILVDSSERLSEEMKRIIRNLDNHWRRKDVTIHINNWIDQYEGFSAYFDGIAVFLISFKNTL